MKTWSVLIKPNDVMLNMMSDSLSIYDQALYFQRQEFFKARDTGCKLNALTFGELYNLTKETDAFKKSKLDHVLKSAAIRKANDSWSSYIKARIAYKNDPDKFSGEPSLPRYLYRRKKYTNVYIDKTRLRYKDITKENEFRLPCTQVKIQFPPQIRRDQIRQVVLQYYYGKVKVNIIYDEDAKEMNQLNMDSAMGIDIGVNNLCAITVNDKDLSYVVKGGPLKSINQYYNKKLTKIQSMLEKCNNGKTSKKRNRLSLKRTNKINDYMHNASRMIINICIDNNIGHIIIGHNDNWKQKINMGDKNNQNFVQIPFNNLIDMIRYKGVEYGILVETIEESYTSKCDHLVMESMEHHDKYDGKRIKRGQFKSSTGKIINADVNGSIGILRKAKAITDAQIMHLRDRGDVVSPAVLRK